MRAIEHGRGQVDAAGDLTQLPPLYRRHREAIAGKHPVSTGDLDLSDADVFFDEPQPRPAIVLVGLLGCAGLALVAAAPLRGYWQATALWWIVAGVIGAVVSAGIMVRWAMNDDARGIFSWPLTPGGESRTDFRSAGPGLGEAYAVGSDH